MEIRFGRYLIRSFEKGDASSLVAHGNNRRVWLQLRNSFPHPYRQADAIEWIRFASAQQPETNFAIASKQECIGGIGLRLFEDVEHRSGELGYWLGETEWGKGIATEAVKAFLPYCYQQFELARIFAEVFSGNAASMRVLEKNGFELEGILRRAVLKDGELKDKYVFRSPLL